MSDGYREYRIEPGPGERVTFDNTYGGKLRLDEIVMQNMNVHVEAMNKRDYVFIINDTDRAIYINARDVWIWEADGIDGLTDTGEPDEQERG